MRPPAARWLLPLALLQPVAAVAGPVEDILAEARAGCEAEGGSFAAGEAVSRVDLDGVPPTDRIVDLGEAGCIGASLIWCDAGGCRLHAVVADRSWSFRAEGWRRIAWDARPILLLARDGRRCGGSFLQGCVEAVTWSGGDMLSVAPGRASPEQDQDPGHSGDEDHRP